jgi:hypothetical protein
VIADGKRIAERGGNRLTRSFGAGYPDLENVVEQLNNSRSTVEVTQRGRRKSPLQSLAES